MGEGSDLARTTVRLMRLLREAPHRRADLMDVLGVSRSTADRLLRVLEEEGEPLTKSVRGREAWYRLSPAAKET